MVAITLQRRQTLASRVPAFGGLNGRGNSRAIRRFGSYADLRDEVASIVEKASVPQSGLNYYHYIKAIDWPGLYSMDADYAKETYRFLNQKSVDPEYLPTVEQYMKKVLGLDVTTQAVPAQTVEPAPPSQTPTQTVNPVVDLLVNTSTPVQTAPVQTIPTQTAPVQTAPAQTANPVLDLLVNTAAPGIQNPPGQTDDDYKRQVADAQVQAAALEAQKTANAARARREAEEAKAEEERIKNSVDKALDDVKKDVLGPINKNSDNTENKMAPASTTKNNALPWLVAAGVAFMILKG